MSIILPGRQVVLVDEAADLHDARVVHEHVERPELLLGGVEEAREGGAIGDVERKRDGARAELRRGAPRGIDVEVADRHAHALAQEGFGGRAADATCGARDRGRLSGEYAGLLCHWILLSSGEVVQQQS